MCSPCRVGTRTIERGASSEAFCLEPTGIVVVVTKETLEVQMKVELPYTKDSFDADAQNRFLWAVASSVKTHVDNLYIKSVAEKTSSRRLSRYLLAASVEVEFAIRVSDAAAQAAMITNDGLTEANLNTELAKQVVPPFRVLCAAIKYACFPLAACVPLSNRS